MMTSFGKFLLACLITLAPLGLGMLIGMVFNKDFLRASAVILIILLVYAYLTIMLNSILSESKIEQLEAEVIQLKEGKK